jgi:hypothetical protein
MGAKFVSDFLFGLAFGLGFVICYGLFHLLTMLLGGAHMP